MTQSADSPSSRLVHRSKRLNGPHRWFILLLVLTLMAPLGVVAARQLGPNAGSPATGHAQVITQGIADLAGQQVVWRLVERVADPRDTANYGQRDLGFVLASEEPILLTNATSNGAVDVARVAPGEAFLVNAGVRQKRASMTDQAVKYLSLELVPAADADLVISGKLIFKSDPFTAPTGEHDVDLVRDVLTQAEETIVPDSGQATVILASEGAIDVVPSGGRMRTLQAGEAGIFQGELRIRRATAANADKPLMAALTESVNQGATTPRAAFVAGVIGVEIPPIATDTPTQAPVLLPTATEIPVVQAPTDTPIPPTQEVLPTETAQPTETATETETATVAPTETAAPTDTPTQEPIGVIQRVGNVNFVDPTPTTVVIK
jgi:hypothetical protein